MRLQVEGHLREALETAGLEAGAGRAEPDPDDPDRQSLLIWYPKVTAADEGYVRPAVKIESGAKSALDPNQPAIVKPYVADVLADLDLSVPDVRTVVAERTFWDKVVILHGLRQWFDARGALRGGGERISRHYYRLLGSDVGRAASRDFALGVDCVRHARMFFNNPDLNLAAAEPGSFTLSPSAQMTTELVRDYTAMAGMIFGRAPALDEVPSDGSRSSRRASTKLEPNRRRQAESGRGAQEHDHTGRQLSKIRRAPAGARHSR